MKTIFSSDGLSLHFPSIPESMAYEKEILLLNIRHYVLVRNRHGIWASNQNKFVETVQDLNPADGRYMEKLLSRYEPELITEVEPHRGRVKLNGML